MERVSSLLVLKVESLCFKELQNAKVHVQEARKKAEDTQAAEEIRKKMQREIELLLQQLDESEATKERVVQSKKKLQQEVRFNQFLTE